MSAATAAALGLVPPREGRAALEHDPTFETVELGWSALRGVVDLGADALRSAGVDVPALPDGSLEELLVLPLTGDWAAIRQGATAARQVERAATTWSRAVAAHGVRAAATWQGAAAASYVVRVEALALAGRAWAGLLGLAADVLDEVARECERLAVRVEELVVELGERLVRLVRALLVRVSGPLGWAVIALDVLTDGPGAVTDLVDDLRRVADLVDTLRHLQEQVHDWARVQAARLDALDGLHDVLRAGA